MHLPLSKLKSCLHASQDENRSSQQLRENKIGFPFTSYITWPLFSRWELDIICLTVNWSIFKSYFFIINTNFFSQQWRKVNYTWDALAYQFENVVPYVRYHCEILLYVLNTMFYAALFIRVPRRILIVPSISLMRSRRFSQWQYRISWACFVYLLFPMFHWLFGWFSDCDRTRQIKNVLLTNFVDVVEC